jgi:hypothetical protein
MNDKEHRQMLDLNPDASTAEKLIATFEKRETKDVCWLKGRCSFVNDTERKETSNETAS